MREFRLNNTERTDCYVAVNFSTDQKGFKVSDNLDMLVPILNQIKEGSYIGTGKNGTTVGMRYFDKCSEKQLFKLNEDQFNFLKQSLTDSPWQTLEKAISIKEFINGKLADVPKKLEEKKKKGK